MSPRYRAPQNSNTCTTCQQIPIHFFSRPAKEALADTGQGLLKRDSDAAWVVQR